MLITNKNWWYRLLPSFLIVLLLACLFGLPVPAAVHSDGGAVTITEPTENIKNTVSKETAIGLGGSDSNNVTFKDQVPVFLNMNNPDGVTGKEVYAGHTFTATGGAEPYSFAVTAGVLPAGMVLNGAVLEGKPTESGTFVFTVTVTDSADPADTDSHEFTLVVDEAEVVTPVLNADTTDNKVGQPIELTFMDDGMWRSAISGVLVDGAVLQPDKYTVSAGKISIAAGVFTAAKEYTIVVEAEGYEDATVTQIITASSTPDTKDPPALTADSSDNLKGQPIELTFTDDGTWRSAISGVFVDGVVLQPDKYTVSAGKIAIVADVFEESKEYAIVVKAGGYPDASVTQTINTLVITGAGVTESKMFTQPQLETMSQHQYVYSCINTWPSKKWYVGKGVKLSDLLAQAGMKGNAKLIKFSAGDGYTMTLTVQEILTDKRYCFPNFKTGGDGDGHIPGDPSGKVKVETILGLVSAEGTDDPSYMNETNALLLMLGQRSVIEQTGPLFVKNVNKIEVLTTTPGKWDTPKATPSGGEVPAGTMVELHSESDDLDKVHYTMDGSTPTIESPMYNWIASRWWSSRGEKKVAEINHPLELTKDTVIKAITIGSGKMNSDVVTFSYKVRTSAGSKITSGEGGTISLGEEAVLEIPEGALTGSEALEVKIERVAEPPAAPKGFKLLSDMFDFSVDGKKWYRFAREVTIKLSFAPEVRKAIPVIYCYDEFSRRWINLGGEINGTTITVQMDHFTKFAVMAAMEQGLADIAGHWAEYSIKELLALGAISGYPDGTFKPDKIITRAEFATVLVKSFQLGNKGEKTFVDTEAHWAKDYIAAAEAEGIVNGYDTETFGPDDPVTREQMAVMTVKAAKVSPEAGEPLFDDSGSISAWAGEALVTAMENGLIEGYADNTVRPQDSATRAEAVTVIVNALHKAGERKI